MFVMDKVVMEDTQSHDTPRIPTALPDGSTLDLQPSSRDAFCVFEDLCLLANSEKAHFLKLDQLHKTFALELIESVLTNYHALFHKVRLLFPRQALITSSPSPRAASGASNAAAASPLPTAA